MNLNRNELHIQDSYSPEDSKRIKRLIWKNLIIIGFSWIFLFTAFQSIASVQSSLNTDKGLGTVSLSAIYVALILSSLFLPTILMKKLGIKWTIFVCQLTYILYILANLYPRYYTLLPAAIILGSLKKAAPLWTAQSTFVNDMGSLYSKLSGETVDVVTHRFFGVFYGLFQSSNIWGNIILSTVLKRPVLENSAIVDISFCGAKDCPGSKTVDLKKPSQTTIYILCAIFIGCSIVGAILILALLNTYKQIGLESSKEENKRPFHLLLNTLKHLKNLNQILVIPLTLWSGFEQGFISADFTKSFISCIKSADFIGYVMITYGVSATLSSYVIGYTVKYIGRGSCIIASAIINYVFIFLMIFWKTSLNTYYILFIIAIFWGISDSGWNTQINTFYGIVFKTNEEAAYSNFKLWQSLGFAISYAYSDFICTSVKLYLLLAYLTIAMIGYGLVEYRLKYKQNS